MTENKRLITYGKASQPLKRFSCLILACSFLTLSACEKIPLPGLGSEKTETQRKRDELKKELTNLKNKKDSALLNTKNLFGKNIRSTDERIERLERAVQDMRDEFDNVKPSIKRLMALESEIQKLVNELQELNESETHIAAPPAPIHTPAPVATPMYTSKKQPVSHQKKMPPATTNGKITVYDVRVGEHPGKTRIVMDTNGKTNFNVDIDNTENIAIIDLPQAGWSAKKSQSFNKSSFISSYKVESSGSGHILILQLKRNAKVGYKADLKGSSGSSRRLVFDLIK